eukprot:3412026-Amphidinium_carterae.1
MNPSKPVECKAWLVPQTQACTPSCSAGLTRDDVVNELINSDVERAPGVNGPPFGLQRHVLPT